MPAETKDGLPVTEANAADVEVAEEQDKGERVTIQQRIDAIRAGQFGITPAAIQKVAGSVLMGSMSMETQALLFEEFVHELDVRIDELEAENGALLEENATLREQAGIVEPAEPATEEKKTESRVRGGSYRVVNGRRELIEE